MRCGITVTLYGTAPCTKKGARLSDYCESLCRINFKTWDIWSFYDNVLQLIPKPKTTVLCFTYKHFWPLCKENQNVGEWLWGYTIRHEKQRETESETASEFIVKKSSHCREVWYLHNYQVAVNCFDKIIFTSLQIKSGSEKRQKVYRRSGSYSGFGYSNLYENSIS